MTFSGSGWMPSSTGMWLVVSNPIQAFEGCAYTVLAPFAAGGRAVAYLLRSLRSIVGQVPSGTQFDWFSRGSRLYGPHLWKRDAGSALGFGPGAPYLP